jgi:hypothetical protein
MASRTYNIGSYQIQHRDVDYLSDNIEIILVKSTYVFDADHTNAAYAAAEISGVTGYTGGYGGAGRKLLGGKTITNDTVNDRTVYDANDPSSWTLGIGDTVGGAIIGKKGSVSDADAVPIFFLDCADTPTNGSIFQVLFDALGIGYTQQ